MEYNHPYIKNIENYSEIHLFLILKYFARFALVKKVHVAVR